MREMVDYIDHNKYATTDKVPKGGEYEKEALKKHNAAFSALQSMMKEQSGSVNRKQFAHEVGKNVANSPVNLFIGDAVINSTIQAHLDQNQFKVKVKKGKKATSTSTFKRELTPRSERAEKVYKTKKKFKFRKNGLAMRSSD